MKNTLLASKIAAPPLGTAAGSGYVVRRLDSTGVLTTRKFRNYISGTWSTLESDFAACRAVREISGFHILFFEYNPPPIAPDTAETSVPLAEQGVGVTMTKASDGRRRLRIQVVRDDFPRARPLRLWLP